MNAPLVFDTRVFVRKLEASGMESRQAEALAEALGDALREMVATKTDLNDLGRDLRHELRELELRLKHDLVIRLGGTIAASTALTVAILGALISLH